MPTAQSIETKPAPRTPAYWEIASPAERTATRVFARAKDVSATVAREIAELIRAKAAKGERCVLGLATGSTPTGVYDELVRLHREESLSFKNVVTFNLDEYWPMQPHELQSYRRFMREHLFDRIDIDPANTHIPDGTAGEDEVRAMCDAYERLIRAAGGIDLVLSDWNMQPTTGLELLQRVRADDEVKAVPFVMVTAEAKTENVVAARAAGVNNYVLKPFTAATLKQKIVAVMGDF